MKTLHIPRKVHPEVKDRWDLIRKHGQSRKDMVNFICGIGGYGGRHDRYAIEFNVKDYFSDLSADSLWELLCSDKIDVGPDKDTKPEHMAVLRSAFDTAFAEHEPHLWDWGVEEAYEGWKDSDSPYETWAGVRVEWEWTLEGRASGHLCMISCEGIDLCCSEEELEERLLERDGKEYSISTEALEKLFIICVQNSVELQSHKISEEIEYRAAWRLWVSFVEEEVKDAITLYETRDRLSESAGVIYAALNGERPTKPDGTTYAEDFMSICTLAGVSFDYDK